MKKLFLFLLAIALMGCQSIDPPEKVVMDYAKSTLGSLPDSAYDEALAKSFLMDSFRAEFTDSSFIPLSYGIQDGPERVELGSMNKRGDEATVELNGFWDNARKTWQFNLKKSDGIWKIESIQ